jgi:hypothetical protein
LIIFTYFQLTCFSSSRSLQEKLAEAVDRLQQQAHMPPIINHPNDPGLEQFEHDQMHRTIDELIEQAAVKTRSAV